MVIIIIEFVYRHMVVKVKVKVEHLIGPYSAPSRHSHHKGAQVHGAHQAASDVPALYLPS